MSGPIKVKRFLRRATGLAELTLHDLNRHRAGRLACIFYYHRVSDIGFIDPHFDDRNVSPRLLEQHLATLAEFAEVVPLPEMHERLMCDQPENGKPLVSLTFDDGYANFRLNVLPLLERYKIPATLAVATAYMGSTKPAPFDGWAQKTLKRSCRKRGEC